MAIESAYQKINSATQTTNAAGPFPCEVVTISATQYKIPYGITVDTSGTVVDFATQTTLAAIAVDAAAIEVLLGTIDTDTGAIATSAASIDTKTPALGQALAAASVPVVLTAAQISTLTPPAAITGFATAANQSTEIASLATLAGAVSGTEVQVDVLTMPTVAVTGTFWQATQPVSGTVAVTGTQTDALTDTQLRATAVPVSGTVTANLSATDNAVLDAIAASVAGTLTVGSHAVTNAGTFAVQAAQSGTWNVTNISGTVSLPTGASTAAKQPALGTAGTASADVITVQGITSMTALKVDGSAVTQPVSGTFWQATQPVSGTVAVTGTQTDALTDTQLRATAVPVSAASLPLPTGAATLAEQQTQTTALQLLDDSVVAVDAVGTSAKVLMQGAIRDDALSALTPIEGDAVNLRTDANGALWVIPNGTTTISGTVTANAGTNLNTSALALESGGNLAAIRAGVAAPEGSPGSNVFVMGAYDAGDSGFIKNLQCSINGELYIAASNPLATRATGSTAHDVALSDNPVAIGGYASAAAPTSVSADGDVTYVWCLRNGSPVVNLAVGGTLVTGSAGLPVAQQGTWTAGLSAGTNLIGRTSSSDETSTIYNGTTALTPKYAVIAASSSGNNTIVAAVTSKKIRVLAYNFIGNGAVNAKWQSGAGGTDLTGLKYIAAAGGGICAPYNPLGWFETGSNTLLNLNLSGAVAVGGEVVYCEV